jgi:hypothetical protein
MADFDTEELIENVFAASPAVRYVAVYHDGVLVSRERQGVPEASSSESDRFEELLVNPTILKIADQRGNIDCGGLRFVIVGYGNFFQLIKNIEGGHISICLEKESDPLEVGKHLERVIASASA